MDILIVGANFSNKGAEAMMLTVKQELSKKYPGARFLMICRRYEMKLAVESGFVPVATQGGEMRSALKALQHKVKGKFYKTVFKKRVPYVFRFPFGQIKKMMKDLEMVIDVSGFAYADSWGPGVISETIRLQRLLAGKKVKFYFLPQAWGSFNDPEVAKLLRKMLSGSAQFFARDLVSRKYLSQALQQPEERIPMMHDIVFAYEEEQAATEELDQLLFWKKSRLLIGISPNLRVYEKTPGEGKQNAYVQLLLELSNYCIHELQAQIIIIPNEMFPPGVAVRDDTFLGVKLGEWINQPEDCFVVDQYYSAGAIRNIVSRVDILAGSRFHALIFGFLHAKPVMAISWSHKYKELFRLFGLDDFVLEANGMDAESAKKLMRRLVDESGSISATIQGRLPELRKEVASIFEKIVP